MRTIQEVGVEILEHSPKSFYIFGGTEYGIKCRYLSILKEHYNGSVLEGCTMSDIISSMSTKHFIPLQPQLYIVRYDEEFVSKLDEALARKVKSLNIIGTVVCIYESDRHITKLNKYLSDYIVCIDNVSTTFKQKYLYSEFTELPDKLIQLAATYAANYQEARNICACMLASSPEKLLALSDDQIIRLFGKAATVSESQIKVGIASKNFTYLIKLLEGYEDVAAVYYTILSTMLELEKVLTTKYAQSDLKEYAKRWTLEDIYNMFMHTYNMLIKSRSSNFSNSIENSLIYLCSLLKFDKIPSVEWMEVD